MLVYVERSSLVTGDSAIRVAIPGRSGIYLAALSPYVGYLYLIGSGPGGSLIAHASFLVSLSVAPTPAIVVQLAENQDDMGTLANIDEKDRVRLVIALLEFAVSDWPEWAAKFGHVVPPVERHIEREVEE